MSARRSQRGHLNGWLAWSTAALLAVAAAIFLAFHLSPWPSAQLIRLAFDAGARDVAGALEHRVPERVWAHRHQQYMAGDPDAYLDVFFPAALNHAQRLPTVVWSHGGAYISGHRHHIGNYARILADRGFTVVTVGYSLAPGANYPTPVRQVNAALAYLVEHAERLHVDTERLFLAGDSAGAHISAQLAAVITDPDYAMRLDIVPTIAPAQLAGVVLYCGPYSVRAVGDGAFGQFMRTVLWAYSGDRNFRDNEYFALANITEHVGHEFPPAFISAGNADPLLPQSLELAHRLQALGVVVDTLFFDEDHAPALGHEYQFVLELDAAELALERSVAFMTRHARSQSIDDPLR